MVHAYFRVTGTHESIFDVSDLMGVTLWGPLLWVSLTHRPVRCGLLAVIYGRYTAKALHSPSGHRRDILQSFDRFRTAQVRPASEKKIQQDLT